ncbi:Superkiller protein 3 [Ascosphaera acerosa]|nr:Superkiller protein 3 [Ascosphaera acerosa]
MSAKAQIKSIRSKLDSDPQAAADEAQALLQQDPSNYSALVFLGFARAKLQSFDAAEDAYHKAIALRRSEPTAYQGLIATYQRQGGTKLQPYEKAVRELCDIFLASEHDDATAAAAAAEKCSNALRIYANHAKAHGSAAQYRDALLLQCPTAPYYSLTAAFGHAPDPAQTFARAIEVAEADEREFVNREIGERRTRIGARLDLVVAEVKREAFARSRLDTLYRDAINWTRDDAVRYVYEEKLFQRAQELLLALPAGSREKAAKRDEVARLARDMVVIKRPYQPAWDVVLEWENAETLAAYDVNLLRQYMQFFDDAGLAKVLEGFLRSSISPFPPLEEDEAEEDAGDGIVKKKKRAKKGGKTAVQSPEHEQQDASGEADVAPTETTEGDDTTAEQPSATDVLFLMTEGLDLCPTSILAHRILGEFYAHLEEWESAADIARKAIRLASQLVADTGVDLQDTTDAINIILATALIHHQSPRHHPEAKGIFETILQRKPTLPSCLLGLGLILVEDHDFTAAARFLEEAMERDPDNLKVRSEHYWSRAHNGELEAALDGLLDTLEVLRAAREPTAETSNAHELKAELLYRIGYCQWELDPTPAGRKDRTKSYASFLASIQANINYAPAYTSLGFYYADYKKDAKRARRCFHKAFELSTVETDAAERLARDFADQQDWAVVEAIAERVVGSGRAKPAPGSKRRGLAWPYSALGIVKMNRQQYPQAIVNFQSALRIEPRNYEAWVGLGESYHHSGRYGAATRAFEQAESLEPDLDQTPEKARQVWFTRYMLANVRREIGDYDDAIARYEAVVDLRPGEIGVLIALIQTLTESARKFVDVGLFGEAAKNARKAILLGAQVAASQQEQQQQSGVFSLWKALGDAFSIFTWVKGEVASMPVVEFRELLQQHYDEAAFQPLADVDQIGFSLVNLLCAPDAGDALSRNQACYAAVLAYKRAITASATDVHAQSVAWYNLGWAEYRAYLCEEDEHASGLTRAKRFLKAAVRCFKRAIELEAGNAEFWNALGVVTMQLNARVAQHCFVRSLHLNEASGATWTNLGSLYLTHNDYELAGEAFTRAQSADPDYAPAWLALGLVSLLSGEVAEARAHFRHALEIGTSAQLLALRQFATTAFDHLLAQPASSVDIQQVIQPLFALHKLHVLSPGDLPYEHLLALYSERAGDATFAATTQSSVCASIEAQYESTESVRDLYRFAQANADLARARLAAHDYEAAATSADAALTISAEEGAEAVDPSGWKKLRLSAHMTAGLAHYYLHDMDRAIEMFREALSESAHAPEVVCLLAQVLWAKGGDEERDVARDQLLSCVEEHPGNVPTLAALAAVALLDNDGDAIEAVEADLQEARLRGDGDGDGDSNGIRDRDRLRISRVLVAIAAVRAGQISPQDPRYVEEALRSIMLAPFQPQGWVELARKTADPYAAVVALRNTVETLAPKGTLDATDLAASFALLETEQAARRSIMAAPWVADGWVAYAEQLQVS